MKFRLIFEQDNKQHTKEVEGELVNGKLTFDIENETKKDLKLIKIEY